MLTKSYTQSFVAGLVPATQVFAHLSIKRKKAWMAGSSPATNEKIEAGGDAGGYWAAADRNCGATCCMNRVRLLVVASCGSGPRRKGTITPPMPSVAISAIASATRAGDPWMKPCSVLARADGRSAA